jgi:hypothetical protein
LLGDSSALQKRHLEETSQFQEIIDERTGEIRDLTLKLNRVTADFEQQIDCLNNANGELKDKLR